MGAISTLKILVLLCLITLVTGCNSSKEVEEFLKFPDPKTQFTGLDSSVFLSDRLKVIHYINMDCGDCVMELEQWNAYIQDKFDVNDFVFIATSIQGPKQLEYLMSKLDLSLNIFFDQNKAFYNLNKAAFISSDNTVLFDNEFRIRAKGNPIQNSGISEKFQNLLLNQTR